MIPPKHITSTKEAKMWAEAKMGVRKKRGDCRTEYAKASAEGRLKILAFRNDIMCRQIVSVFPKA